LIQEMIVKVLENGVELSSGIILNADIIIFATGQSKTYPFIDDDLCHKLGIPQNNTYSPIGFRLYRNTIPIDEKLKNIAFNGIRNSTDFCINGEVTAHWISDYFQGNLIYKSTEERKRLQDIERDWLDRNIYHNYGMEYGPYTISSNFVLMKDMNLPQKLCWNWVAEYLVYFKPSRIKKLLEWRKKPWKERTQKAYPIYIGFKQTLLFIFFAILWKIFM